MRKIISLGLFALMLSIFSGQIFAGNAEICDPLKLDPNTKKLYGLCVAYQNANENAKIAFADAFFERAGFDVPGSGFSCPCWYTFGFDDVNYAVLADDTEVELNPLDCLAEAEFDAVTFSDVIEAGIVLQGFSAGTTAGTTGCGYFLFEPGEPPFFRQQPLSTDLVTLCRAEVQVMAEINQIACD